MPLIIITSVLIGISLIIYILIQVDISKKSKAIQSYAIETLKQYGEVYVDKDHLLFDHQEETYEILFFRVGLNSELTINSRSIWEIRDSSSSRLIDQTAFLSSPYKKIVLIYPSTLVIKRYINENEMEFVKINSFFYDMYVLRAFELESFLQSEKS